MSVCNFGNLTGIVRYDCADRKIALNSENDIIHPCNLIIQL